MNIKLSEMQKSALVEAGNIGSGHAAIALSQLMGKKIMIAIPSIELFELSHISDILRGEDANLVQISLAVYGDARGVMLFTLENDMAVTLCDAVMGQPKGSTEIMGEIEISAMKEVGSIISASYLNALSEMTAMSLIVSTPESNVGDTKTMRNILSQKNLNVGEGEQIICIRTEFTQMDMKIDGFLFFIPAGDAITAIMRGLGV